jgi:hypothetical protein
MTIKKLDLDRDGKVSFSDFETTVKVTLLLLHIEDYGGDKQKGFFVIKVTKVMLALLGVETVQDTFTPPPFPPPSIMF